VAHFSIDMQPLTGLFSVAALSTVGSHVIPFGLIFIIAYERIGDTGRKPAPYMSRDARIGRLYKGRYAQPRKAEI
jgi:hypothetical protein